MTQEEIVKYINSLTAEIQENTKKYNEVLGRANNALKQIMGKLLEL